VAVEVVRNRLEPAGRGGLRAVPTGERETVPAGIVFRSVGYRGVALPGVPFDEERGVIRNVGGRVIDEGGTAVTGVYAAGWIKRGPSGVIGTNKKDAQETVDAIFADLPPASADDDAKANDAKDTRDAKDASRSPAHTPETPDPDAIESLLRARQPDLVTYSGWEAIDRHERSLGEPAGRPRVKLTRIEELLRVAASEHPSS
jgi:ferredoxin--NADP+ reductase